MDDTKTIIESEKAALSVPANPTPTEGDQANDVMKELQVALKSPELEIVTIPAGTLTLLLSKVDGLSRKVEKLDRMLIGMQKSHVQFQKSSGALFAKFNNLPPEIRRMIWRHARDVPHVISFQSIRCRLYKEPPEEGEYCQYQAIKVSSGRDPLMQACSESRTEVARTTRLWRRRPSSGSLESTLIQYRPTSDMIWMRATSFGAVKDFTPTLQIIRDIRMAYFEPRVEHEIKTVGISWNNFFNHYDPVLKDTMWQLFAIKDAGADTVLLVVGDESICDKPDVTFIKPILKPHIALDICRRKKDDFTVEDLEDLESMDFFKLHENGLAADELWPILENRIGARFYDHVERAKKGAEGDLSKFTKRST